jgi:uncharacterized protein (TIGR03086 family)
MTDTSTATTDSSTLRGLETVLARNEQIIAGVAPGQAHLPTPCPDFDVTQLLNHILGWAANYAARLSDRPADEDPNVYRSGPDPRKEFHASAAEIVAGYRRGGQVAEQLPIGIVLMDSEVHGWDLATATGQHVSYGDEAVDRALQAGKQMLKPEFRGPGQAFGPEVEPQEGATALETLVAFLGRDPSWKPSP